MELLEDFSAERAYRHVDAASTAAKVLHIDYFGAAAIEVVRGDLVLAVSFLEMRCADVSTACAEVKMSAWLDVDDGHAFWLGPVASGGP